MYGIFTLINTHINAKIFPMKPHDKKLIISLIKDDLINSKLVNELSGLGLNADGYLLHIKETVLDLMGFTRKQRTEQLYAEYMDRMEPLKFMDVVNNQAWVELWALTFTGGF